MKQKSNKRQHIGISMDLVIYHPRKNISNKELDKVIDEIITMVEKRGWYCGGGSHFVDINSEEDSYIHITPKHIVDKNLNNETKIK